MKERRRLVSNGSLVIFLFSGLFSERSSLGSDFKFMEASASMDMEKARMNGKCSWFSEKRGYGFVKGEDGQDYFVHYSKMVGEGFKTLHEGQPVRFIPTTSPRGLTAVDLEAVN